MDILVVDLARVLDGSKPGSAARDRLFHEFTEARAHWEKLRAQAKSATGPVQKSLTEEMTTFEKDTLARIEGERQSAREVLLGRAREVIERLRQERGATYVVDASAVVLAPQDSDITDAVIAALDEG